MKKNFISILITNYNKDRFLKNCLNSLKKQNFKNFEVIIFDDCSTDESLKIIRSYTKFKLIKNKKRQNSSAPLNQINGVIKAFNMSRGNLICLLDSDDYFKKNKLKVIDNKFKKENINSLYNFPKTKKNKFELKNKNTNYVWPTIFPTSCITISRKKFKSFQKHIQRSQYLNLEIDARLTIFLKYYSNEYNVLKEKLTIYNYDKNSITAKISKFSVKWWLRRFEAFQYLKFILSKKKKTFKISFDYLITIFFSFMIKFLKL